MNFFSKLILRINFLINKVENSQVPIGYFLSSFIFIVILRNFLEFLSDKKEISATNLWHYYSFYCCIALSIIILFRLITKEDLIKIIKIISVGFSIIILAPLIDFFASVNYNLCYLLPGLHDNLPQRFLSFFGEFGECGISIGIRVEVAIIILSSLFYFYLKTNNKFKSLLGFFASYILIFAYSISPFFAQWFLSLFGLNFKMSSYLMFLFFLLLGFFQIIFLAFLYNKKKFIEIIKDLRFLRLIYFLTLFVLGLIIGRLENEEFILTAKILFNFFLIPISFLFTILFSIITNNLADYNIDIISNEKRPHVNSDSGISKQEYKILAFLSLILTLIYSAAAGQETLFLMSVFLGNYFLYSMPPLRLKRITFFSKLVIGVNSFIMILLGYVLIADTILSFPPKLSLFVIFGFTAAANFIDIKDYEGDKHEGVKTLPVVLGLHLAKWVCGIIFLLINLSAYFLFKEIANLSFLILFGSIEFYLVIRKEYKEKLIFIVILISILFTVISLRVEQKKISEQKKYIKCQEQFICDPGNENINNN